MIWLLSIKLRTEFAAQTIIALNVNQYADSILTTYLVHSLGHSIFAGYVVLHNTRVDSLKESIARPEVDKHQWRERRVMRSRKHAKYASKSPFRVNVDDSGSS